MQGSDPKGSLAVNKQIIYNIIVKFSGVIAVENGKIYSIKTYQPSSCA